ncbi:MAG: histidinol dehydrogenase [Opitutales bacterium]|nr:histidinol dehydrogenase [Opitutales bacterium]
MKSVESTLKSVRLQGDAAILELTEKYDGAKLTPETLRVSKKEISDAVATIESSKLAAIKAAIDSVTSFHSRNVPSNWQARNAHNAVVGERFSPIQNVGLYIPGGKAPLCSTVIMTAIPAKVAGVPHLIICTPPRKDGTVAPEILATAHFCGISEIYKVGGAQAIAAMAYGTATIPRVDKIAGPGNAYVVEAKRALFGFVGIDLLPGPSELMVVVDRKTKAQWAAIDLLAQAEHGSGRERLYIVSLDDSVEKRILDALHIEIHRYSEREAFLRESLEKNLCIINADSLRAAVEVINFVAPEHLELQTRGIYERSLAESVTTAGAILSGHFTPAALGDFVAGPSHTLPTNRTGRFASGLRVEDFIRRSSFVRYDEKSIRLANPIVSAFAGMEGLKAHGDSVAIRQLPSRDKQKRKEYSRPEVRKRRRTKAEMVKARAENLKK